MVNHALGANRTGFNGNLSRLLGDFSRGEKLTRSEFNKHFTRASKQYLHYVQTQCTDSLLGDFSSNVRRSKIERAIIAPLRSALGRERVNIQFQNKVLARGFDKLKNGFGLNIFQLSDDLSNPKGKRQEKELLQKERKEFLQACVKRFSPMAGKISETNYASRELGDIARATQSVLEGKVPKIFYLDWKKAFTVYVAIHNPRVGTLEKWAIAMEQYATMRQDVMKKNVIKN